MGGDGRQGWFPCQTFCFRADGPIISLPTGRGCGVVSGMLARESIVTVIDFETTGVVGGHAAEPWQFGLVQLRGGVVDPATQLDGFVRVGERPFSPHAPGTWMQHLEAIGAAPALSDWWPALRGRLEAGSAVAGHSIGTERKILRQLAPLHAIGPWIDTLKLVRLAFPDWTTHTLGDAVAALRLTPRIAAFCPGRAVHDALYDAVATAVLLEHLLQMEGWREASIEALVAVRPAAYHRGKSDAARRRMGR